LPGRRSPISSSRRYDGTQVSLGSSPGATGQVARLDAASETTHLPLVASAGVLWAKSLPHDCEGPVPGLRHRPENKSPLPRGVGSAWPCPRS
jgi:hypothetical protein